jgi:hypothetical protein
VLGTSMRKPRVNFTLTKRAKKLLEEIAKQEGMSQSGYLEMMIRQNAARMQIVLPPETVEIEGDEDEGDE